MMKIIKSALYRMIVLALASFVLPMLPARADFAADIREPLSLLDQKKYDESLAELNRIAPQYQDQFLLHYMLGIAWMGKLTDETKAGPAIEYLRQSRRSLLQAQKLADDAQKAKEATEALAAAEEALRELGAPLEDPATATDDKDQEIAELKRRLAELEAQKAAANVAAPDVTAPVTPLAATAGPPEIPATLPKLPPLQPQPGAAVGRVVDRLGWPLQGAELSVRGTTMAGEKTSFFPKTNAQGRFSLPLPDGLYTVRAEHSTTYNGQTYKFRLYPLDGEEDVPQSSRAGVVEDFVWRPTGLRPGLERSAEHSHAYFGAQVDVTLADISQYGPINDPHEAREKAELPSGFQVEITLTPDGPLVDGHAGETFVIRENFEVRGNGDWPYLNSFRMLDVPVGRYRVQAELIKPTGQSKPFLITTNRYGAPQTPVETAILEFEPETGATGGVRPPLIRLYYWPVEQD